MDFLGNFPLFLFRNGRESASVEKRGKKKKEKNFFIDFAQFYFAPFYFAQFFRKNWRLSKGSRELPISEKEEKEGGRGTHQWSRLYKYL